MLLVRELQNTQTEQPVMLPLPTDEMLLTYPASGSMPTVVLILAYSLAILKVVTPLLTKLLALFEDDEGKGNDNCSNTGDKATE